jgi:NADPH2:quinone reductase
MRINETGGPEVLTWEERVLPPPGPGEVLVRHTAIGLNFTDVHRRRGDHHFPTPVPCSLGLEAAGRIAAAGEGVTDLAVGDRVVYAAMPLEAYSDERILTAERVVRLPEEVDDRVAAAAFVKGLTVQFLVRTAHRVAPGEVVVFHAAAGGVGLIACQWLRHLGATVIGTVGNDAKVAVARAHGADHVCVLGRDDFAALALDLTGGKGVPVVYDSIGRATFENSLRALRPRGLLAAFGNVSGHIPPVQLNRAFGDKSLFFTWAKMHDYLATRAELEANAGDLFAAIRSGAVRIEVNHAYPLVEAARAHADLEARRTTGSCVLIP